MAKLGIYLVPSRRFGGIHDMLSLVIAESAAQAAEIVAMEGDLKTGAYLRQTEDTPGRLGDYEPGMEGHYLVSSRPRLILDQEV